MALYKVDSDTADLTLVAGLPSAGDVMDFKYMSVTYNDLTSASGWTAPYAGIMMANVPGNASNRIAQFKVNGTLVADNGTSENLYRGSTFAVPKGGVVTVHDASGTNNFYAIFAYVTGNAVLSQSMSYSTTETLTGGTWIDGKPIYRKVILNPTLNTTLLTGVDEVVNYRVKRQCHSGTPQGYVYFDGDPANGVSTTIYISLANNEVKVNNIHSPSYFNAQWVLLEYTKTTD